MTEHYFCLYCHIFLDGDVAWKIEGLYKGKKKTDVKVEESVKSNLEEANVNSRAWEQIAED